MKIVTIERAYIAQHPQGTARWGLSLHYARVLCEWWGIGSRIIEDRKDTHEDGSANLYTNRVWELRRDGWWYCGTMWQRTPTYRREYWSAR
jgi:hypothetical protein